MALRENSLNIFRSWLTCNIQEIMKNPELIFPFFWSFSHKTRTFYDCFGSSFESAKVSSDDAVAKACMYKLRQSCLSSRFRVIKTIRTPIDWLYDLMKEFPTLTVIHLVRDPRAVANSLYEFDECSTEEESNSYYKCLQYFCGRLEDDLTPFDLYSQLFPGRIFRVNYEQLALEPIKEAELINKKLKLNMKNTTREYIYNITQAGQSPAFALDTVRKDSKKVVFQWMTDLNKDYFEIVQYLCKYSITKLGYTGYRILE